MVKPSQRRQMAKVATEKHKVSVKLVCLAFQISETCYRYQPKLSQENTLIADWLIRITHNQRNWEIGLCYLYLRNVKGFGWSASLLYLPRAGAQSSHKDKEVLGTAETRIPISTSRYH